MGQVNQPSNLLDRIIQLERQITEVRKKVGLASATISSGGLTIQGGFLDMIDPDGDQIVHIGPLNPPRPDGLDQQGVFIRDDEGHARITMWDPDPSTDGYRQFVAIWDNSGNIIFSDDADSGQGVATPYLHMRPFAARFLDWPKTANGAFETIFEVRMLKQQPKMHLSFLHGADGGTTGNWEVLVNGVNVGNGTVDSGVITVQHLAFEVPGDHLTEVSVDLRLRRNSGAGLVGCQVRTCYGRQS